LDGIEIANQFSMLIENNGSRNAGFLDFAIVPIKSATARLFAGKATILTDGVCTIGLLEEAARGISMEKRLFSGPIELARSKVIEMITAGRIMVLAGFPLEEIAEWCFQYKYRWRIHRDSSTENVFIVEPGNNFNLDAKEAGAETGLLKSAPVL